MTTEGQDHRDGRRLCRIAKHLADRAARRYGLPDLEELEAAALLAVAEAQASYRDDRGASLSTWAYFAGSRKLIAEVRKIIRRRQHETPECRFAARPDRPGFLETLPAPPADAQPADVGGILSAAELPARSRTVIRLRFVDGLTYRQIGRAVGVSSTRVEQILRAAYAQLRPRLARRPEYARFARRRLAVG